MVSQGDDYKSVYLHIRLVIWFIAEGIESDLWSNLLLRV